MGEGGGERVGGEPAEVWDGELPDVWDGPLAADPAAVETSPASLDELYGERLPEHPAGAPRAAAEVAPGPGLETPRPAPVTAVMSHVVVPAATIVMVSALLFFLYDVRAVFLPGSFVLKWVGVCFASATVLIARYVRMYRDLEGQTSFYTLALAIATVLTIWASPWEAPGVGVLGALSNGVIIFLVWRFATALTGHLSADLDHPPPPAPQLYGLARLEMETWRHNTRENRASIYDIGRRRHQAARSYADGEAAARSVARLALLGLLLFALCEPLLLAGAPEIAGRALGAMVAFLLASGVVIAAAAAVHDQQRLLALGVRDGLSSLVGRLGLATSVMLIVLAVGLGLPGVVTEGRGEIKPRPASEGVIGDRGEPVDQEGGRDGESADGGSVEGEKGRDSGSGDRSASPAWVSGLASLGKWLRWPFLALLGVAASILLWRFGPSLLGALRVRGRGLGSAVVDWFRRRRGSSRPAGHADPLAGAAALAGAEPRAVVLAAYGVWLDVCGHLGQPRQERQTPLEFLASLPRRLSDLRPAGERLTRLYLQAAYGTGEIDPVAARTARGAVEELAVLVDHLASESRR